MEICYRVTRVILVSMMVSVWVILMADELITYQSWGFPRNVDIYAAMFIFVAGTLICLVLPIAFWVIVERELEVLE
jgi:hypothetical protein